MAYLIGMLLGAIVGTLLFSRAALWAFKKLGDNQRRIFVAYGAMYAVIVLLGGLGYADGGGPRFGFAAALYGIPTLLWLAVDLLALKGRMLKAQTPD